MPGGGVDVDVHGGPVAAAVVRPAGAEGGAVALAVAVAGRVRAVVMRRTVTASAALVAGRSAAPHRRFAGPARRAGTAVGTGPPAERRPLRVARHRRPLRSGRLATRRGLATRGLATRGLARTVTTRGRARTVTRGGLATRRLARPWLPVGRPPADRLPEDRPPPGASSSRSGVVVAGLRVSGCGDRSWRTTCRTGRSARPVRLGGARRGTGRCRRRGGRRGRRAARGLRLGPDRSGRGRRQERDVHGVGLAVGQLVRAGGDRRQRGHRGQAHQKRHDEHIPAGGSGEAAVRPVHPVQAASA